MLTLCRPYADLNLPKRHLPALALPGSTRLYQALPGSTRLCAPAVQVHRAASRCTTRPHGNMPAVVLYIVWTTWKHPSSTCLINMQCIIHTILPNACFLVQGQDLRVYSKQVEDSLRSVERESVHDYIKEAGKPQLHLHLEPLAY